MHRLVPTLSDTERPAARWPRALCTVFVAAAALIVPLHQARAEGVSYDMHGHWVRHPDRYLLTGQPPRIHVVPRPAVTAIHVFPTPTPPPPPPPSVVHVSRDAYDTAGVVVAGAGLGGIVIRADGASSLAPAYRLHLGLAMGAAEFAVRLELAPDALSLPQPHGSANDLALYATRASFDYRFLSGSPVHPVAGLGLASIVIAPDSGEVAHAFAATARAGLELAFPISSGALAMGLDATGHLPFARSAAMPIELGALLSFGAYLDYRF